MTVEEMLTRISSTELTWWKQLFKIKADELEEETRRGGGGGGTSSSFGE